MSQFKTPEARSQYYTELAIRREAKRAKQAEALADANRRIDRALAILSASEGGDR